MNKMNKEELPKKVKTLADISSEFNVCRNFKNCKTNVLLQYPEVYCYKCAERGNKLRYSLTSSGLL